MKPDLMTWVTTGKLNTVDDVEPASYVADPVVARWQGIVGHKWTVDKDEALLLSDTAIGTLYGGDYQYVRFKSVVSGTFTRGKIVYWDDRDNFIVTVDAPADARDVAGLLLATQTAGRYGFIQNGGLCSGLYRASVTDTTIGAPVFVLDDDVVLDALAIATAWTGGHMTRFIGTAVEAPANSAIKLVRWNRGTFHI